jgi:hypothetical protein
MPETEGEQRGRVGVRVKHGAEEQQGEQAGEQEGFTEPGQGGGFMAGQRELGFVVGEAGGAALPPPRAEIRGHSVARRR